MRNLPTGTVAFLMTDIEGSTRLITRLGDAFPSLLDDHFAVLEQAIKNHRGTLVSTEGDSAFAVFRSVREAIDAAVVAQRALAAHPWPDGVELGVRVGIHVGEAVLGGADYTGSSSPHRPPTRARRAPGTPSTVRAARSRGLRPWRARRRRPVRPSPRGQAAR